jgi:adenosyl cobinamide kinase/adenosyl cobinamide phosphate guanylyltransferase
VITLVLGGARSGKSRVAERLAAELPEPVTYIGTAATHSDSDDPDRDGLDRDDPDMAARIAVHRARRPATWRTVEAGQHLCAALTGSNATVLVDSLGAWVAACPDFDVDVDALRSAICGRAGDTVIVSEEVGLGVHPSSAAGRRFRDTLGLVNQMVAELADEVLLVVAGRILRLEQLSASP